MKHDGMHDDSSVVHLTKLLGLAYTAKVVLVVSFYDVLMMVLVSHL